MAGRLLPVFVERLATRSVGPRPKDWLPGAVAGRGCVATAAADEFHAPRTPAATGARGRRGAYWPAALYCRAFLNSLATPSVSSEPRSQHFDSEPTEGVAKTSSGLVAVRDSPATRSPLRAARASARGLRSSAASRCCLRTRSHLTSWRPVGVAKHRPGSSGGRGRPPPGALRVLRARARGLRSSAASCCCLRTPSHLTSWRPVGVAKASFGLVGKPRPSATRSPLRAARASARGLRSSAANLLLLRVHPRR